ncbi:arginine deiminase-related protein, partial [Klebsiella pneumoniae]|uniref:arginine deiminase-related protein n=1 Tax=Klebsiella pneumoniae TaxID=573 RepID=UPI003013CB80
AGNTLELEAEGQKLLVISDTGYRSLTVDNRQQLERFVELVPVAVPTLELGGGSIRCMLAQVFPPRNPI